MIKAFKDLLGHKVTPEHKARRVFRVKLGLRGNRDLRVSKVYRDPLVRKGHRGRRGSMGCRGTKRLAEVPGSNPEGGSGCRRPAQTERSPQEEDSPKALWLKLKNHHLSQARRPVGESVSSTEQADQRLLLSMPSALSPIHRSMRTLP